MATSTWANAGTDAAFDRKPGPKHWTSSVFRESSATDQPTPTDLSLMRIPCLSQPTPFYKILRSAAHTPAMAIRCLVSTIVLAIVPLASGIGFEAITGDVFPSLSRSWPKHVDISSITPLFDMDDNGCYPAAVISRTGEPNRGLETDGGSYDVCKRNDFLEYSNTYHRYACRVADNIKYCSHFFTLYFQKDEATLIGGGHRHDLEQVVVWTMDGNVTHGSFSAHGGMTTWPASSIPREGSHLKFVYHKDNIMTHAMRFARTKDALEPENPYKKFVLPPIVSWYTMKGDGDLTNSALRQLLNTLPYGKATMPIKDSVFLRNLNMRRPQGYPEFDDEDIKSSQ